MADAALRADVIAALRGKLGDTAVVEIGDGSIEVSAVDQPIRRFPLGPTVSRGLLGAFQRWYEVPIAAFYPPIRTKPQTNAAGE